ncbi:MAG: hypothetical protein RBS84_02690 [Kiritimatiellia bacterium]|nr:hypothetical protein [Kiritimatiellia bacterium]
MNKSDPKSGRDSLRREKRALSGVLLLTLALLMGLWVFSYYSTGARLRRASLRIVQLVEKTGDESPVALGLAAHRLGKNLAEDAVLDYTPHGILATGRQEIVQLFAQIRSLLAQIRLNDPQAVVLASRQGEVTIHLKARYRLVPEAGAAEEGNGSAELLWRKGADGWRIDNVTIQTEDGARFPGNW